MKRSMTLLLAVCALLLVGGALHADVDSEDHYEGAPSGCAADMPGAEGTIEFEPDDWMEGETTWWIDTDGVAPNVAGCHVGTDSEGEPNGRKFGEQCLSETLLVESNPGGYALHSHGNDLGHPDTFDCVQWCQGTGAETGACEAVGAEAAPPCEASARCVCT